MGSYANFDLGLAGNPYCNLGYGRGPGARRQNAPRRLLGMADPVAQCHRVGLLPNPGFRTLTAGSENLVMPMRVPWWKPSATQPGISLHALWLFNGIYFSCLNLALGVERRTTIRAILAIAAANAVALSVFGTIQKARGVDGHLFRFHQDAAGKFLCIIRLRQPLGSIHRPDDKRVHRSRS